MNDSWLNDSGILPAISWFSRETEKIYPGVSVNYLTGLQEEEIPEELKIVVFLVLQESVRNAIDHGKSTRILIGLERNGAWFRLSVMDNGKGFVSPAKKLLTDGSGLGRMQQRVESTAGIFSISSAPEKGTIVKAEWRIDKDFSRVGPH